jgi:hypothetical protein
MIIAIVARFKRFENKYQKQFIKYQRNINFDIDKYQNLCYNINVEVIDMVEFEKIIYDLVAKVSVLETKVSLLQDRIAELESNNVAHDGVTEAKADGRDKTRYSLDGVTYLKNRFVWAVVNKYIQEHQNITYDELITVFADKNQGSFGVVRRVDSEIVEKNPIRYFCKKDDDLLTVADGKVTVCNQWSKSTVINIFSIAVQLGYSVEKI